MAQEDWGGKIQSALGGKQRQGRVFESTMRHATGGFTIA
jgi:hypothetical protein